MCRGRNLLQYFVLCFSTFYALKAYSPPLFSISHKQNPLLMGMRKACSPLSRILFYLSVIPFHLPFPLFPKHLPFFFFFIPGKAFGPSLFSLEIQYLSSLIFLPFDVFPGSSAFTCCPYPISPLFSIFSSCLLVLAPQFTPLYLFHFLSIVFCNPFFPQCFYLSFTYLFPHIKKEPQHGSHLTPALNLICISLF